MEAVLESDAEGAETEAKKQKTTRGTRFSELRVTKRKPPFFKDYEKEKKKDTDKARPYARTKAASKRIF